MIDLLLASLAVWRASVLLVEDAGPWHLLARLRARAGIVQFPDGTATIPGTFIAGVLSCVRCCSIWLAIGATFVLGPDGWRAWLMIPLALSGASVLIEVFRRR